MRCAECGAIITDDMDFDSTCDDPELCDLCQDEAD